MEDADKPLIDFWIFGPERGCLMREIPIIRQMAQHPFQFRIFSHKKHEPLIHASLGGLDYTMVPYPSGLSLFYKQNLDIAIYRTLASLMVYALVTSVRHYLLFRREIQQRTPSLVINDYLPFVPVYAQMHRIPVVGIYNYRIQYTSLGKGVFKRILSRGIRLFFSLMYSLHDPMIVEQILPENTNNGTREVPVIARGVIEEKSTVMNRLGIDPKDTAIYLSLGGGATALNETLLGQFERMGTSRGWKIFLHPRSEKESDWLTKRFPSFSLIPYDWVETQDVFQCMSTVVARAGFTTVAECIRLKIPLILWHMETHPEIRETEEYLVSNNLCGGVISESDTLENIELKILACLTNASLRERLNSIPSDGDYQAKKIILETYFPYESLA